ncbi:MAG: type IV secretion protein IcmD [Pseudomonadota bacterium]|nr:type IV secretion protein IcmD [Pseudomonadota bacterium]
MKTGTLAKIAITSSFALLALSGYANIGDMAESINNTFTQIAQLIGGAAYVAGLGFGMAAIFKFKQHRDNPTQVPVGTPFGMLGVAIMLIYLPSLLTNAGSTVFSSDTATYGVTGSGFANVGT